MSKFVRYRQFWMATLKDRHQCQKCGELAVNALYLNSDNGVINRGSWQRVTVSCCLAKRGVFDSIHFSNLAHGCYRKN
jgi:hypothetical protein